MVRQIRRSIAKQYAREMGITSLSMPRFWKDVQAGQIGSCAQVKAIEKARNKHERGERAATRQGKQKRNQRMNAMQRRYYERVNTRRAQA